jgi:long-chain acyl-CoA synthetase
VSAAAIPPLNLPVLGEVLRRAAACCPERPAIVSEDSSITYAELDQRANRAGRALSALGVGRQGRVAFLGRNRIEYFEILFGGAKAGLVTVPVNWRLAPAEVDAVIADTDPSVLVVEREYAGLAQAAVAALGPGRVVLLESGLSPAWEELLGGQSPDDPALDVSPEEVMFQLYTSGTTGSPKGVMVRHSNLVGVIEGLADAWCFDPGCVVYVPYPAFHAVGNGWVILTLSRCGTAILRRGVDPADFVRSVEQHRVTNAMMVPSVLQRVLEAPEIGTADLRSLRYIVYGAAPIPEVVLERALAAMPDCGFVHCYGLTEATGMVSNMSWPEHKPGTARMRSCGRPFDWVEMRVVDMSTGEDVVTGSLGEVWTRSPCVMKGYWRRPVETAEAITPEGWLRTGDVGYVDEEGYLYLTDRVKDMIISGGENIFPAEVENVLHSCPGVRQAAVVGVPDERWGEAVKAIVVLEAHASLQAGELIDFARARLAHYKCPSSVDFRTEPLPLNPTGKVLRRQLREPYWAGHTTSIQ